MYYDEERKERKTIKMISYHVFADYKSTYMNHSNVKNWDTRSLTLLEELKSYDADVICLQDVDHFTDWWRPQFMQLGYDSFFKQRTQMKGFHYEGVLVAFRSSLFQLFKTVTVDFNDAVTDDSRGASFREHSKTDDVALLIFLQPWALGRLSSAVCVVSAMFSEGKGDQEVRLVQCQYLAHQIEIHNRDFQVPVLLGLSLFDVPSSLAYNLLRTGRIPLSEQVPQKCKTPYAVPTCRSSVLLRWLPPVTTLADPPLLCYRIAWRPGGSKTLGFRSQVEVSVGDCVRYAERIDENRNKKIYALDEMHFVVSELGSDLPYEFKVAAVNEVGEGAWSDVSDPVVMANPIRAPEMPGLENFANLSKLNNTREQNRMQNQDWDADLALRTDPLAAQTQLTPRDFMGKASVEVPRGRVLPYNTNPRTGWNGSLGGSLNPELAQELQRESVVHKSVIRHKNGFKNPGLGYYVDVVEPSKNQANNKSRDISSESLLLDCKEVLDKIGVPNPRQVHNLSLRSAYEDFGSGSEPFFNASLPGEKKKIGTNCVDYIFFSAAGLHVKSVLSIPTLSNLLGGEYPQTPLSTWDRSRTRPYHCASQSFNRHHEVLGKQFQEFSSTLDPFSIDEFEREKTEAFDTEQSEEQAEEQPADQPQSPQQQQVSRHEIDETKRKLKQLLIKSYQHGSNPREEGKNNTVGRAQGRKGKEPGFWGGLWAPVLHPNHQRYHFTLPNKMFCSTHLAVGAELEFEEYSLGTLWT